MPKPKKALKSLVVYKKTLQADPQHHRNLTSAEYGDVSLGTDNAGTCHNKIRRRKEPPDLNARPPPKRRRNLLSLVKSGCGRLPLDREKGPRSPETLKTSKMSEVKEKMTEVKRRHSSYFMESYHTDIGATFFRSVVNIRGRDWVTKIRNCLENGTIKHNDVIVILSGTRGPKTALTDKTKANPVFIEEDKNNISKLDQSFPNHCKIELINVADYHMKPEELKRKVMALNPKNIVFSFCKSNDSNMCKCDVKQLFLRCQENELDVIAEQNSVCIQYNFNNNIEALYNKVIKLFTTIFRIPDKDGCGTRSYNQDIEDGEKQLVGASGIRGSLKRHDAHKHNQNPSSEEEYNFILVECDSDFSLEYESNSCRVVINKYKCIRFHIKRNDGSKDLNGINEILGQMDKIILEAADGLSFKRNIMCKVCLMSQESGSFEVTEDLELKPDEKDVCEKCGTHFKYSLNQTGEILNVQGYMIEKGIYPGVILKKDISGNGRKKLLIIGKTGAGKSSLCNVICGHKHDDKLFPVSAKATTCTQRTQFGEVLFNQDNARPIAVIDTIGFSDPDNDDDAKIIAELVDKLKNSCDYVNLIAIAVNGQNSRLDVSLVTMIKIFEGMFGDTFWKQVIVVFTKMPMDKKSKQRREENNGQTDDQLAKEYMVAIEKYFKKGKGLGYLFLDSWYDEKYADDQESKSFKESLETLYTSLDNAPGLPTSNVKAVETQTEALKKKLAAMEKERKEAKEQLLELKRQAEVNLKQLTSRFQLEMTNLKQKAECQRQEDIDSEKDRQRKKGIEHKKEMDKISGEMNEFMTRARKENEQLTNQKKKMEEEFKEMTRKAKKDLDREKEKQQQKEIEHQKDLEQIKRAMQEANDKEKVRLTEKANKLEEEFKEARLKTRKANEDLDREKKKQQQKEIEYKENIEKISSELEKWEEMIKKKQEATGNLLKEAELKRQEDIEKEKEIRKRKEIELNKRIDDGDNKMQREHQKDLEKVKNDLMKQLADKEIELEKEKGFSFISWFKSWF